jgi:hypothetical protein
MIGPGIYDEECGKLRESTGAAVAFAIIMGGDKGSGFSAQFDMAKVYPEHLKRIPEVLRHIADSVEKDIDNETPNQNPP